MIRLGLCCAFIKEDIKFRSATARYVLSLPVPERWTYVDLIARDNTAALLQALKWCAANGVGAFRINSQFFPLYTHPQAGYALDDLPSGAEITTGLKRCGQFARSAGIRLSFHPDQFVVPGSPSESAARMSLLELEYQARIARLLHAEQLTLHGGGAYGDKTSALKRTAEAFAALPRATRELIALENDDRVFTVKDLAPLCAAQGMKFIYDVHHHRCLPDGLSETEALKLCVESWRGAEPWLHLSSPLGGWSAKDPRAHADYINPRDVPAEWLEMDVTVDIEAKAKELAVLKLKRWLKSRVPAKSGG
ncbi:MAG TPA: UV DNA damage repair endonuclease UvsE [Planctomycetota bacterium]|nr:UV DNA damage repair endonuclease UvsE [Planctomycetota bacterium]